MNKKNEVSIEINGNIRFAKPGTMIIEATDAVGEYVPRFCYHKSLSIAANCRMCLVEVEGAPKPLPACATPVSEGMKVWTKSEKAKKAQHGTMEFLLINHPLDCPICDQGGECELQDLAVGYGSGVSQYSEAKRVVEDKNIGPLIKTEMTRCIHCTRCVRFGEEIAGIKEMGAIGRGEHVEIGTYIESGVKSELSGNMIDVCPVGALTSKPYRYSARSWEMRQSEGVAPHDGLGSNINFHIKGQNVKRVVPRENENINDIWISDRDRFSYEGLTSPNRLIVPKQKIDGRWISLDWDSAFDIVKEKLKQPQIKRKLRAFASPSSTNEELFLLQALVRAIGSNYIDHRLRQTDFSNDQFEPLFPKISNKKQLEESDLIVLIGAFPRTDLPTLNISIRNSVMKGAKVLVIDSYDREFNHKVEDKKIVPPSDLPRELEKILKNLNKSKQIAGKDKFADLIGAVESPVILFGSTIDHHPERGYLVSLINRIARKAGATAGNITHGSNAAGAWLAGAVPCRKPYGSVVEEDFDYDSFFSEDKENMFLLFGVDPLLDFANAPRVISSLEEANFVVGFSAFESSSLLDCCDLVLPIAAYAENEGSFINCFGITQKFKSAVRPPKETKLGWKILRRLGFDMGFQGFEAIHVDDIFDPFTEKIVFETNTAERDSFTRKREKVSQDSIELLAEIPPYSVDQLLRNAVSLQRMPQSGDDTIRLNELSASKFNLSDGDKVGIEVAESRAIGEIKIDNAVPARTCLIFGAREPLVNVALNGQSVRLFNIQGDV
ncbi:MAG: NADH-quinone oxidoreductase subunit NuoG [Pseudomonadota bacterium]|nr:NADH-quinone oxidoreductase subunit NuoG [Pseudomonadota bacterium]